MSIFALPVLCYLVLEPSEIRILWTGLSYLKPRRYWTSLISLIFDWRLEFEAWPHVWKVPHHKGGQLLLSKLDCGDLIQSVWLHIEQTVGI